MSKLLSKFKLGQEGFTLLEVFIAVALLAVTSILFAQMFTQQGKANKQTKTIGIRDIGYYQVGKLASDPSALAKSTVMANYGVGAQINPCLKACRDGMVNICPGGAVSACPSYDATKTGTARQYWYPLTLFNPVSGVPVSGPNYNSTITDVNTQPVIRYTRQGQICTDTTLLDSYCPIQAKSYFNPVCPQLAASCTQPTSILVKYDFSWSTSTSIAVGELAALKSLSNQIEIPGKLIWGSSVAPSGWSPPTTTYVAGGTGSGSGTGTVTASTSTPTATSGGGTGTGSASGTGTGGATFTYTDTGCFRKGTLIATRDGQVPIEKLKVGTFVWSVDHSGDLVLNEVTHTMISERSHYNRIYFADRSPLEVSDEHPFWRKNGSPQGWYYARQLRRGDVVLYLGTANEGPYLEGGRGGDITITDSERVNEPTRVYNITVRGAHNYFANGILVHNKVMTSMDTSVSTF